MYYKLSEKDLCFHHHTHILCDKVKMKQDLKRCARFKDFYYAHTSLDLRTSMIILHINDYAQDLFLLFWFPTNNLCKHHNVYYIWLSYLCTNLTSSFSTEKIALKEELEVHCEFQFVRRLFLSCITFKWLIT